MNWLIQSLWSSVGKKFMMAATGTGFILFLCAHLIGNLTLYGGGEAFNACPSNRQPYPLRRW